MITKKRQLRGFLTFALILVFLISGVPALNAQDIVASKDITGGSSVFVFRPSSNKQRKVAYKSVPKRTVAQKKETRIKVVKQTIVVAKVNQKKRPTKRVDPPTLAKYNPKTMPAKQASLVMAGAGEYFLERDDITQAIGFFRESVTLDSTNKFGSSGLSDAYTRQAGLHLEKDEIEKAKFFYEEAIKYDDRNATAYAGLGEVYSALEDDKEALKNYEKALQVDPELSELYAPVGILYYQQASNETADAEKNLSNAEKYLSKALAAQPADAQTQYFLGLIRNKQNRLEEALTALRRSLQLDANNPETHYYLGEVYGKQGKDKEAIAEYQKAVELDPKYVDAWFDLGVAQYNAENYAAAEAAYKKVITLKNDYWEAHANLGDTYRMKNDFANAEGSYRIAASRITDDAELFSKYGYVLTRLGRWRPAIEQLNNALNIDKNGFDYANLGFVYYNAAQNSIRNRREAEAKENLENGRIALQQAVQVNDKNEAGYLNLGITLIDLGDYAGAAKALERANALRKDWLPALNELGIAYRKLGRLDDAIKQFQKVVDVDTNFAAGYYNLGEALYRNQKTDDAKKVVDKLKPLNPRLAKQLEYMIAAPRSR